MSTDPKQPNSVNRQLHKTPTGISGFDSITDGGLPKGRTALFCGGSGSGKTLMAMEFLLKGAVDYDENGVFISFEESKEDLYDNVSSFGYDMDAIEASKRIHVREIDIQSEDLVELGTYTLEGLFAQIGFIIDSINAKRIVLDGIATLFSNFTKERIIRKELKRLFRWLKSRGMTAIVTSERGDGVQNLSRFGIEEYISDCVILLDQRLEGQVSTRRLRIIKYRGSKHGTNEYPFLVTSNGISVFPITSMTLEHDAPEQRVPTGITKLNEMLENQGYYKGSSILITGTAGTGKSSFAASFARAICEGGERCIYFSFEESENQILRNMNAIGVDLKPFIDNNLFKIQAVRPTLQGLEMHLLSMHDLISQEKPAAVIMDPITNLNTVGNSMDIKLMFIRIMDFLKKHDITALYTALTPGKGYEEATELGISSVMDTWILLKHRLNDGYRERSVYIMKARGISHSNQIHCFRITSDGIQINGNCLTNSDK